MNKKQKMFVWKRATHAFGLLTQISLYPQGYRRLDNALYNGTYVGWETGKALGKVAIIHRNHLVIPQSPSCFLCANRFLPTQSISGAELLLTTATLITFPCFAFWGLVRELFPLQCFSFGGHTGVQTQINHSSETAQGTSLPLWKCNKPVLWEPQPIMNRPCKVI